MGRRRPRPVSALLEYLTSTKQTFSVRPASQSYCKVTNNRKKMAKSVVVNRQLVNSRTSVLRGPCTAVEVAVKLEQGEQKKKTTAGRKGDILYTRLSALGTNRGYVAQTINEYVREGRVAQKDTLENCVKGLRRFGKHHLALEIFEWMEKRKINFGYVDQARRLDLIAKVHGITAAENYLNGLSPSERNLFTYGALLNSYCQEKMIDKALDLFEKMDEEGVGHNSLAFNNLMSLYMKLCQPEKVPPLVLQMKEREVQLDTFTYNIWMNSYSSLNDIEGVERVFDEIKQDGEEKCDWTTYSNLALAYVKAGLIEKAELALKKCEQHIGPRDPEAFGWLIRLYAQISNLAEVHRVWKSRKSHLRVVSNMNYLTMLYALCKLNDIEGMQKCFEEWESKCSFYDTRLVKAVMGSYLKHDMIEEAKKILYRAIERSNGPFFIAWELLMQYYLNNGQMELALECLEAATTGIDGSQWCLRSENESKFLSYFEEEKDIDGAEKFCKYLRKLKPLDSNVYKMLLQTYTAACRTAPDMRKRIEEDGIDLSLELKNLLENVCPE